MTAVNYCRQGRIYVCMHVRVGKQSGLSLKSFHMMQAYKGGLCSMVGAVDSRHEDGEAWVKTAAVQGSLLESLAAVA